jgi:hemolysin activation/secretion protein
VKSRTHIFATTIVALGVIFAVSQQANAQAYQRIAPQPLPAAPPAHISVPTAKSGLPSSHKIIRPRIAAIIVTDPAHLIKTGLAPTAAGPTAINVTHAPSSLPSLADRLKPFLGRPMTFDQLRLIANAVIAWYKAEDRPFMDVTVPAQDVNSGVVQIQVLQYRVGRVRVSGTRWFSKSDIRDAVGIKPGETLTMSRVERGLDWANQNAFRTVNAVFSPGDVPGTTDLNLKVHDRLPLRVYAGFDNEGVPSLGRAEWSVGFNWGNAFGLGQTLSYQLTRSVSGRYTAQAVSDTIPLSWHDDILIFGSYETERPLINTFFGDIGQSGQASIRYEHTLRDLPSWISEADAQIGYDYKVTNSNLEFFGTQVLNSNAEVDQFPVIVEGSQSDSWGATTLRNEFVYSPGGLQGGNTDPLFQTLVPGAKANYVYDRMTLTRLFRLPRGFVSVTRLMLQDASTNLLDSEQLVGGGPGSAIGYPSDVALGSMGVIAREAIYAPSFKPARLLGLNPSFNTGKAQVYAFWNYADLHQITTLQGTVPIADLASVGLGINYGVSNNLDVRFATGWQLRRARGYSKTGAIGQLSVIVGF